MRGSVVSHEATSQTTSRSVRRCWHSSRPSPTDTHARTSTRTHAHAHRQTDRPRYICSNRPRHQSEILRFLVIQYLKTTFEQTASSLKVLSAETVRHWKASGMMLTDAGERLRINSVLITK